MKYSIVIAAFAGLAACVSEPPLAPPAAVSAPILYAAKPSSNLFAPWLLVRDRDVADARAFEASARRFGVPVVSDVARSAQKNDEGRNLTVDTWKGSNMGLPPAMLSSSSPQIQQAISYAAEFSANRGEQARIIVSVSEAEKPRVRKWLDAGLAKGRGRFPTELQWRSLKKGDLPFLRVEPADPEYGLGPFNR